MHFEAEAEFVLAIFVYVEFAYVIVCTGNSPLQRFIASFAQSLQCLHTTLLWAVNRVFENCFNITFFLITISHHLLAIILRGPYSALIYFRGLESHPGRANVRLDYSNLKKFFLVLLSQGPDILKDSMI